MAPARRLPARRGAAPGTARHQRISARGCRGPRAAHLRAVAQFAARATDGRPAPALGLAASVVGSNAGNGRNGARAPHPPGGAAAAFCTRAVARARSAAKPRLISLPPPPASHCQHACHAAPARPRPPARCPRARRPALCCSDRLWAAASPPARCVAGLLHASLPSQVRSLGAARRRRPAADGRQARI
jgi:hypothetical protein